MTSSGSLPCVLIRPQSVRLEDAQLVERAVRFQRERDIECQKIATADSGYEQLQHVHQPTAGSSGDRMEIEDSNEQLSTASGSAPKPASSRRKYLIMNAVSTPDPPDATAVSPRASRPGRPFAVLSDTLVEDCYGLGSVHDRRHL